MARHLLVTNDYPPKTGGIQNYLWELWRRLPADSFAVHTTPYAGAEDFDALQDYPVLRSREFWLAPQPLLVRRVERLAVEHSAEVVLIDPALPAGLIGPRLSLPYGVILHGAEASIPARLPGLQQLLRRVITESAGVIAAGAYPAAAAKQAMRSAAAGPVTTVIPPGVDLERFKPLAPGERRQARLRLGLDPDAPLVLSVSRLTPRKGMDTLIRASAEIRRRHRDTVVVIAGRGRDERRLRRMIAELGAPVRLLGRIADEDLADLYGCADLFAMLCRNRWGGLEQEGFGIVFVEAAAAGVPQIAGRSGGAAEAVADGETGAVVDDPRCVADAAGVICDLLDDDAARAEMARRSRERAERHYSYDSGAERLARAIDDMAAA